MNNTITRRNILKTAVTTGTTATIIPTTVLGGSPESIRTIEAGIYYDLDFKDDYSKLYLDSRPPFTINEGRGEIWFSDRVSQTMIKGIEEAGALLDERPVSQGQETTIGPDNLNTRVLPTRLTTRMRPMIGVQLASQNNLPKITIQRNGDAAKVILPGRQNLNLEPGSEYEIRLAEQQVEVISVKITDQKVPIDGRPEHRWGPKKDYNQIKVSATPIVKIIDHGHLNLRVKRMP